MKKCKKCQKTYQPSNSLQQVCSLRCAIKLSKEKTKKKNLRLNKLSGKDQSKLMRKADALYQIKYKVKYPYSAISGEPAEAIHHFIFKSDSNNTRYDEDNAVPVTIKEHKQIHDNAKHAGSLFNQISLWLGVERQQRLEVKRKINCKLTEDYLTGVIDEMSCNN